MSNEYDYSGLYRNTQPGGDQPQQNAASHGAADANQQGGYPNVGSSGLNTANTARTEYGASDQTHSQTYSSQSYGSQSYTNQTQPNQNQGYSSSFGGYGSSNGNGGYNGYSYSSAPQQPEPPQPTKKRDGKKIARRIAAGFGVVLLGFGGGMAGTVAANQLGLTSGRVVVQSVERNLDTEAISQGSAGGTTLSLQDVSAIVQPSVVAITTEQMVSANTWFGGSYVQSGAGSGVIISADGYMLTCAHVVNGASNIKVQLSDGTEYTATLVGGDTAADIAVLKVDATNLTPAVLGDSDALAVGETALAVGNPLGTLSNTVTNGIISAVNRTVTVEKNNMTLIQTNASISPGNSGGGLFNGNGELIGIVNAKSGATSAEGIGFAIPINTAMTIAQDLIENGYVKRPQLGVKILEINDATTAMQYGVSKYGVYIAELTPGGGAEKAGLKLGDRIVAIGDVAVSSTLDVRGYIEDLNIGDTVTLQIERDGKLMSVEVTLMESTS